VITSKDFCNVYKKIPVVEAKILILWCSGTSCTRFHLFFLQVSNRIFVILLIVNPHIKCILCKGVADILIGSLRCIFTTEIARKMKSPERETIFLKITNCGSLNLRTVNRGGVCFIKLVENSVEMVFKLSEEVTVQG